MRIKIVSTLSGRSGEETEHAAREIFPRTCRGPWTVHLSESETSLRWFSVKMIGPDRVYLTSIPPEEQRGDSVRRRLMALVENVNRQIGRARCQRAGTRSP
jgi:hypothetical protein